MSVIRLTDAANGTPLVIPTDQIVAVEESPRGQCQITLSNGTVRQPKESVEEVTRLLDQTKD